LLVDLYMPWTVRSIHSGMLSYMHRAVHIFWSVDLYMVCEVRFELHCGCHFFGLVTKYAIN